MYCIIDYWEPNFLSLISNILLLVHCLLERRIFVEVHRFVFVNLLAVYLQIEAVVHSFIYILKKY